MLAFCWMPNHVHALIKTPEPNLCRGMQHWLSGYANWYAKRNRPTGLLFQGRYTEDFLRRVLSMAEGDDPVLHRRRVRSANPVSVDSIFGTTASQYAVSADENVGFRSGTAGRDMAAYLCRRYTSATLRELSERFGLSHPAESRIPSLTPAKPSPSFPRAIT